MENKILIFFSVLLFLMTVVSADVPKSMDETPFIAVRSNVNPRENLFEESLDNRSLVVLWLASLIVMLCVLLVIILLIIRSAVKRREVKISNPGNRKETKGIYYS